MFHILQYSFKKRGDGEGLGLAIIRLAWRQAGLLLLLGLFSCAGYSARNTTFLIEYTTPKVLSLQADAGELIATIGINLNPRENSDFEEYWILIAEADANGDCPANLFQADASSPLNTNRGEVFSSYFQNYSVTNTFSGTKVNDAIIRIPIIEEDDDGQDDGLGLNTAGERSVVRFYNLCLSVVAWGYNEDYAEIYENNGWLLSAAAPARNFYVGGLITNLSLSPYETNAIEDEVYGYVLSSDVSPFTASEDANAADLYITNYTEQGETIARPRVVGATIDLLPIGSGEETFLSFMGIPGDLPYLMPGAAIPGAPATVGSVFFIKHSNGYFSKLYIETEDESNILGVQIMYSKQANLKNF